MVGVEKSLASAVELAFAVMLPAPPRPWLRVSVMVAGVVGEEG